MKTIQSIYLILLLGVGFLMTQCSPSKPTIHPVDPAFGQYISGYTSGMINSDKEVVIELAEPSEKILAMSEEELTELFQFEPAIEGEAIVISDRIIHFVPKEDLKINHFYNVSFDLGEVASTPIKYNTFNFQFATHRQTMNVTTNGLRFYHNYAIKYNYLEGYIKLSQNADSSDIAKTLKCYLDNEELPFKLYKYSKKSYRFKLDSIERTNIERILNVTWNGASINSISNGKQEIKVRALNDFSLSSFSTNNDEDQSIELVFSTPLAAKQNLEGLITINGINNLTYSTHNNTVKVFLPNHYQGTYELTLHKGIKNIEDVGMKESTSRTIYFTPPPPKIRMIGNGSILPNSQGLIFPFETIALRSVDVRVIQIFEKNIHYFLQVNDLDGDDELSRFGKVIAEQKIDLRKNKNFKKDKWISNVINLENLIKTEPGAIYQVAIKFDKTDATCDCANNDTLVKDRSKQLLQEETWNESLWHTWGFNGYSTWSYDDEEDPCTNSYYYGRAVKRNILASNIGLIFKLDEDKRGHIFASDMVTTLPIANASIEFYDYTKNKIVSATTNEHGMASTPLKKKPFLMIAKKGAQRGYLKLNDGHVNSLSKFDVEGEIVQKGVKGFLYAERSVWRPGDTLFINFILQDKLNQIPSNHPVQFEFIDPSGNTIQQNSTNKHENGVYSFVTTTSSEAVTGNYKGVIRVGNKYFEKYFKIETIKPNRLKVNLEVNQGSHKDSCHIQAKWLHGASAGKLRTSVSMYLKPMRTSFKGFEAYTFDSPIRAAESERKIIFDKELDSNGEARFINGYQDIQDAAGMMQANFVTKVYEKGGNFSIDRKVATFSPYKEYLGMKIPKQSIWDYSLVTDSIHTFELVNVNKNGTKTGNKDIEVKIFKLKWNYWYDAENIDLAQFTARNSAILVYEKQCAIKNGYGKFNFEVNTQDYGRYLIIATDKKGGHQTGKVVYFDWPYWNRSNRTDNEFASMLTFSLNKEKFIKGEEVQLSFPSPSDGRALISIETSEKVIEKYWIKTIKGETKHTFKTTSAMAPNAFIHVTMLQPHHTTKNDLPIRMYGVKPIAVDDPNTHLSPVILMSDEIKPNSTTSITIKESKGKAMTYTVAIVDDGLLDLTNFKTPNPWPTFYAKEALGVKTWDMYNYVIGAYAGAMDHIITIGGDGSAIVGNGPKANRFKPMVRHIGPFTIPAGGKKTHNIDIPNYIGSVRVMVVARNKEAYGESHKSVQVKQPLMILATLPRSLKVGEEFNLPVSVFAMKKEVKNVAVSLKTNDLFEVLETSSKNVQFNKEGEQVVNFKIKCRQVIGIGKVQVNAICGKNTSNQEIECDVKAPNTITHYSEVIELKPGQSIHRNIQFDGIKGTNSFTIESSLLPSINLEKRLAYLIEYPHGCVEQTTSGAFPQLYLPTLTNLSTKEQKQVDMHIKAAIQRLQLFQTYEGGLSYWPRQSYINQWGTNYAGHFLLEAEKLGYKLPVNMKKRWLEYQRKQAQNWSRPSNYNTYSYRSNTRTQAYRLYLLALAQQPELGAMNRLKEEKELSSAATSYLAMAYFHAGQTEIGKKLLNTVNSVKAYKELSGTFGSQLRDQAILLESATLIKDGTKSLSTIKEMSQKLSSNSWLSTQETAYSLLAIGKYIQSLGNGNTSNYLESWNSTSQAISVSKKVNQNKHLETGRTKNQVTIKNQGTSPIFFTLITSKIDHAGKEKSYNSNISMNIHYTDFDGNSIDVSNLKPGTEFIATIAISNLSKTETYSEMALSQLFPSGWEIHNSSLFGGSLDNSRYDFQDLRDNEIYTYFDISPNQTNIYNIQLTATYSGKFYLPGTYCEAMYDQSISSMIKGKWISVSE